VVGYSVTRKPTETLSDYAARAKSWDAKLSFAVT